MSFTSLKLDDDVREKRIWHGCAPVGGACYICGNQADGCRELGESSRTVYYLCKNCSFENENVRINISAKYGWIYMHSWYGLTAKIRRSSGLIHDAKILCIEPACENGKKCAPHFRCIWKESSSNESKEKIYKIPEDRYLNERCGGYQSRLVSYETLRELNPHLVAIELHSVKLFNNISIHESFLHKIEETIKSIKKDDPDFTLEDINDYRAKYIMEGKALLIVHQHF